MRLAQLSADVCLLRDSFLHAAMDIGVAVGAWPNSAFTLAHIIESAVAYTCKKLVTLLDLCVSSLRRGHANLLCIVPILTDDLRRGSIINSGIQRHVRRTTAQRMLALLNR